VGAGVATCGSIGEVGLRTGRFVRRPRAGRSEREQGGGRHAPDRLGAGSSSARKKDWRRPTIPRQLLTGCWRKRYMARSRQFYRSRGGIWPKPDARIKCYPEEVRVG